MKTTLHTRITSLFLTVVLCATTFLTGCQPSSQIVPESQPEQSSEAEMVPEDLTESEVPIFEVLESQPRYASNPDGIGTIQPYDEFWAQRTVIDEDINTKLAETLTVSDRTYFAQGEPEGYSKAAIIEWGKDPGLNVDVLHNLGYTGKGAVIAYVDQPICNHEQYNNANVHYVNNTTSSSSMHGPTVLSMLVGKDIGTAPEAEVYYYAHAPWETDQATHAQCLYQIIEQNKKLPEGEKITMVAFSDNPDRTEKNYDLFNEAIQACKDAGIMVWFCGGYCSANFVPLSDKNNPDNINTVSWWAGTSGVAVPTSGRTGASGGEFGEKYIYWSEGGLSWAMPYVFGLYAIANEINPSLNQSELIDLLKDTTTPNVNGLNVVNPVGFIAEVLNSVGREADARELLNEAASRSKYMYAIMDSNQMTEEDHASVIEYLHGIIDATVIKVEAGGFQSAGELYTALKKDAEQCGGTIVGVQIFGDPYSVPTFLADYEVQMIDRVDKGGGILTDLFYSNFENSVALIQEDYSPYDHFSQNLEVDLVPQWPVARLPLEKGEFAPFMEKYSQFKESTQLAQQDIVNFSNPIFNNSIHTDDMGTFLNRSKNEFGILNTPYRLYGNLDGDVPVQNQVLGNFTAENLALENEKGIAEFIINSHGQWNNIDRCIFENGREIRESLINIDTINQVLDDNYYYLDTWTCLNGSSMRGNLTNAALNGQCVGMFSATNLISNNGVNNRASLSQMQNSNFYWFYYNYLEALNRGESRSQAFFLAQKAYAEALLNHSQYGIGMEGNYQFNLCNLLAYHNFGLIELKYAPDKVLAAPAAAAPSPGGQTNLGGGGYTVGSGQSKSDFTVYGASKKLDGDKYIFTVDVDTSSGMGISCFDPPDGENYMITNQETEKGRHTYTFKVDKSKVERSSKGTTIMFSYSDNDRFHVFFPN